MKVLVMTFDTWDTLTEGERGCVRSFLTEVDLEDFDNEAVDAFEHGDFLMPGAYLLAHIKEGKE